MGDKTAIEWTDATWNVLVGCTKVSEGCDHCYAIGVAHRGMSPQHRGLTISTPSGTDWNGHINVAESVFDKPLQWKRPRRIFVNSLSDLFHPNVDDETIARVFAVMGMAEQHTFQCLTKRPQRMAKLLSSAAFKDQAMALRDDLAEERGISGLSLHHGWPLRNVHLGVSIESDKYAWRADHLRATPAAVRWISAEPLLGPLPSLDLTGIDWVVAGGESGPGARPMHPQWVRDLRDRCGPSHTPSYLDPPEDDICTVCHRRYHCHLCGEGVAMQGHGGHGRPCPQRPAFLFKQWGDWTPEESDSAPYGEFHDGVDWVDSCICSAGDGPLYRLGKKAAGRHLDGRTWDEYPNTKQGEQR